LRLTAAKLYKGSKKFLSFLYALSKSVKASLASSLKNTLLDIFKIPIIFNINEVSFSFSLSDKIIFFNSLKFLFLSNDNILDFF